jgi:peptidoglycan/xylan/chitin deacetylase (PgdA/CDA1 family)
MLKVAAKRMLRAGGKLASGDPTRRVTVLCYHSVHPTHPFRSATPELFGQHLSWLEDNCDVVPFTDVVAATTAERRRPAVSITFDDGYDDNHAYVLPALKASGMSATFFVTAGFVDRDPVVIERFRYLRRCDSDHIRPLEWSQVREILDEGMEVGAHTYSHPNLARVGPSDLKHELAGAKLIIEDQLQTGITSLAYPFGKPRVHFTNLTVEMAQESGYRFGAAIVTRAVRETDPVLRIPRIFVTNDPVELLREKVLGYWDPIGFMQERTPLWLSRLVSPVDFNY